MTYQIIYTKNNETVTLEWISPTGWSQETIRECFERQYAQAEIISIEAVQ
tara:strand:- start:240 stop:389 length:150 start_codon:yes stop_codon:yes gene_type:complete